MRDTRLDWGVWLGLALPASLFAADLTRSSEGGVSLASVAIVGTWALVVWGFVSLMVYQQHADRCEATLRKHGLKPGD